MKKLLLIVAIGLIPAALLAQPGATRVFTQPKVPPRDVLDKVNLAVAWHSRVPLEGTRDGYYSLQFIPSKTTPIIVAQTLAGAVLAINAETGHTLWRTSVGLPYPPMVPVAWNDQSIFVVRRSMLFALDRADGKHQLYTIDPDTNLPNNGFGLEFMPSAMPVADNNYLFICMNSRVVRYVIPNFRLAQKLQAEAPQENKNPNSPQPIRQWSYKIFSGITVPPVLSIDSLTVVTDDGAVHMIDSINPLEDKVLVNGVFHTEGAVVAAPAHNKTMVYVGSQDYYLYALDTDTNRLVWRFAAQAPILESPRATDADVFVKVDKANFFRLTRSDGNVNWSSKEAVKFLATNQQFVYALDNVGNMLILDYLRGKSLAAVDTREWVLSIGNDYTDRIYLASHDGQLLCLRNRENVKPLMVKTIEVPRAKDKDDKKKDEEKPPEIKLPKIEETPPKGEEKKPKIDEKPKGVGKDPKVDDKAPKKDIDGKIPEKAFDLERVERRLTPCFECERTRLPRWVWARLDQGSDG